jgi:multimeric flavodoxin WrbA
MNIVTLLGSPRPGKTSATIAGRFTATAARLGAQTCTFELNRLVYRGCQGCYACKTTLEQCVLDDDLTAVLDAVRQADVTVLASPVYFGEVTAQLKGFIDRTFSYLKPDYATSPQPSRLSGQKAVVFVLTQGYPKEEVFADIFPRYEFFMKWMGFTDTRLLRTCGVGPATGDVVPETVLQQADDLARMIVTG